MNVPGGEWPFGMPTSINPWVLVMGISPGKGKHDSDINSPPSVGAVHNGFGGKLSNWDAKERNRFWRRIRKLCCGFVERTDATDLKVIKWVPDAVEMLRPKIVVLLGWGSLLSYLRICWPNKPLVGQVVHTEANCSHRLRLKTERHYKFSVWRIPASWGNVTVILWPNHPSQHPFGDEKNWEKAIDQALSLLKEID